MFSVAKYLLGNNMHIHASEINPEMSDAKAFTAFVNNLPEYFSTHGRTIYDERNVIKMFTPDEAGACVVVKRFRKPNIIQRIVYSFFRKSKAQRAYRNATELLRRGVSTPTNMAYLETWQGALFEYGYYVTAVDAAPPIRDRLITPDVFDHAMAADFARFVADLHSKGILHNDLNSTNVLYHDGIDGHSTFSVIDINRMKFYPHGTLPPMAERMENLTRFTGRMDLFEYVATCYVSHFKPGEAPAVSGLMAVKRRHDERWRRRKSFFGKFK